MKTKWTGEKMKIFHLTTSGPSLAQNTAETDI